MNISPYQKQKAFVFRELINDLIFSFIYNKRQLDTGDRERPQTAFGATETPRSK